MRKTLVTLIGAGLAVAAPLAAQTAQDGDFTFRRVAVPTPGATRRITVQIDPNEQARAEAARQAEARARAEAAAADIAAQEAASAGYGWFWSKVSPARAEAGPLNTAKALGLIETTDEIAPPRLQALQDIAERYGRDILIATVGTDVSPALVIALISVESSGRAGAESGKGAQGLMQLIPATAERFGVTDALDASQNIKGGVAYLDWLYGHFGRDPILMLAGYSAGEGAVAEHDGVPPFEETRAYVPKVLAAWKVARGLCLTPPELITDACVFAVNGVATNG